MTVLCAECGQRVAIEQSIEVIGTLERRFYCGNDCSAEPLTDAVVFDGRATLPPGAQVQSRRMPSTHRQPCLRCTRMFAPAGPHSLYCGRADCTSPAHPEL